MYKKLIESLSHRRSFWILSSLVPLTVFAAVMLALFTQQQGRAIGRLLHGMAVNAAHIVDRSIGEQVGLLIGLATTHALDGGDFETFRLDARRLWGMHPEWRTVILTDAHRPLLNLRYPPGKPMTPLRDPESLQKVWATEKPLVGNLAHGYVAIRVPVIRGGHIIYSLVAPTDPQYFKRALGASLDAQPWGFIVVGSDNIVICASSDSAVSRGERWTQSLAEAKIGAPSSADVRWAGPVYVRSSGWRVFVFAPAASIEAPYFTKRLVVFLGGGLASLLTLFFALIFSAAWSSKKEALRLREEIDNRSRIQKALYDSEQRYRAIVEDMPVLICRFLPDGEITFVNKAYCEHFNKKAEDLVGSNLFSWIPDADRDTLKSNLLSLTAASPTRAHEYQVSIIGGNSCWQRWTDRALFDGRGTLVAYQSVGLDITERKMAEIGCNRAEADLRESRRQLTTLLGNLPGMAYRSKKDPMGTMEFVSDGCYALTGYYAHELVANSRISFASLILQEDRQRVYDEVQAALKENKPFQLIYRIVTSDEEIKWVWEQGRGLYANNGNVVFLEGFITDITDRKQAEEELLQSEERYRLLVENTLDGYFICQIPSGKFIFLNEAIYELFGYTLQEAHALTVWNVIDPEDHEGLKARIQARVEGTATGFSNYVYGAVRKNGSKFRIEVSSSLITYKGEPAVQGIVRDITEKERLQLQLQQAQKMESVGRLAGGVAHDYNNMLSVITGYTELALQKVPEEDPLHDDLKEVMIASKRSVDITRQLLAFARKQTIAPEPLDLNETVEGMLKMLRRLIGEDIDLVWKPGAYLWPVNMDPTQIDQVLANLCINARDAITDVGKVTIETGTTTFDEAYCADHAGFVPGEFVLLAVSDNGIGMDKKTIGQIFEPFFTTKDVGHGTGLGLATVYGIVKQNEGFINVYSEPDRGTTFKIYLRRHASLENAEIQRHHDEAIPPGRGERVLVVEDEELILNLSQKMMAELGYRALSANSPTEALALVEKHPADIDLLMTDVVMPDMNGRELFIKLKSFYPDLKSLFMSGYTANVIAHHGVLEKGVNFIQKPFSKRDLAVRIRAALE